MNMTLQIWINLCIDDLYDNFLCGYLFMKDRLVYIKIKYYIPHFFTYSLSPPGI